MMKEVMQGGESLYDEFGNYIGPDVSGSEVRLARSAGTVGALLPAGFAA